MAVHGHLDGLEGAYLVGWAEAEGDNCCITVLNADGTVVATGTATTDRPDLLTLGFGRTDYAFRIAVPETARRDRLHVHANDTEISNSPIDVGPGLFNGEMRVTDGIATGWLFERTLGFSPPQIRIIDQNGHLVGETQSAMDETCTDPLFQQACFRAELDLSCFGRGELALRAQVGDFTFAHCTCTLELEGHLEQITSEHIAGWLFSPSAPHRNLAIEVFRDGLSLGIAHCEIPRPDLKTPYPASQNPGFTFALPPQPRTPLDFTTLSLRLPGSDIELFNGPSIVAPRPAVVQAARSLARLALQSASPLTSAERSVLQLAMSDFLAKHRPEPTFQARHHIPAPATEAHRLTLIIPIYRGVETTRACIESAIAHRNPTRHRILLINDASPEPAMAPMLAGFSAVPDLFILTNPANNGFVQTVNRGLSFCPDTDALLLNADTLLFPGGLDELSRIAHSDETIGTVTALSNNATIFSYPHATLARATLEDIAWPDLAATALAENTGMAIDVPTGHGFCLLIKRQVLQRTGRLNESFGRGYGEENDLCARAADLGYRNVAAPAVLVQHRESISFGDERAALIARNLPRLEAMYPEYTPTIIAAERQDNLRRGRWALDAARLHAAGQRGQRFALVIQHSLGGGTTQAIDDIVQSAGYSGATPLALSSRPDGYMELTCQTPLLRAVFAPDEVEPLFRLLAAAPLHLVLIHQVLGYNPAFLRHLTHLATTTHAVFYAHDFYAFCPRVTMIDATGQFCRLAKIDVCTRCIARGGSHEASQCQQLPPADHRALFQTLLAACTHVVAPSESAAAYLKTALPTLPIQAIPHPDHARVFPPAPRSGTTDEIVLLGAIGPHKGSAKLLEIARHALLTHPHLRFRVIGYTDIDDQLQALGNVHITGKYPTADLPTLCAQSPARLALFLSIWPETYAYTLSEAVSLGFLPLVPDIGALAERVKSNGFGLVFPFPIDARTVLDLISAIARGEIPPKTKATPPTPQAFRPDKATIAQHASILTPPTPTPKKP